jgi:hypothetical protein
MGDILMSILFVKKVHALDVGPKHSSNKALLLFSLNITIIRQYYVIHRILNNTRNCPIFTLELQDLHSHININIDYLDQNESL